MRRVFAGVADVALVLLDQCADYLRTIKPNRRLGLDGRLV
jgi:hypothetical protein